MNSSFIYNFRCNILENNIPDIKDAMKLISKKYIFKTELLDKSYTHYYIGRFSLIKKLNKYNLKLLWESLNLKMKFPEIIEKSKNQSHFYNISCKDYLNLSIGWSDITDRQEQNYLLLKIEEEKIIKFQNLIKEEDEILNSNKYIYPTQYTSDGEKDDVDKCTAITDINGECENKAYKKHNYLCKKHFEKIIDLDEKFNYNDDDDDNDDDEDDEDDDK